MAKVSALAVCTLMSVIVIAGCGASDDSQTAESGPTTPQASPCERIVMRALELHWRSSDNTAFHALRNEYGTESPEFTTFLNTSGDSDVNDARIQHGIGAGLDVAQPRVAERCANPTPRS